MTLQQIGQVFLADLQRARSLDIPRGMVVLRTGPRRRGVVSTWPCTDISDKHKKTWPIVGENSQTSLITPVALRFSVSTKRQLPVPYTVQCVHAIALFHCSQACLHVAVHLNFEP